MSDVEALRQELAEALWRDDSGSDKPLSSTGPGTQRTYARAASNLLPVVTAWADRVARERAAEELRAAAVDVAAGVVHDPAGYLNARADMNASFAAALAEGGQL